MLYSIQTGKNRSSAADKFDSEQIDEFVNEIKIDAARFYSANKRKNWGLLKCIRTRTGCVCRFYICKVW